MHVGIDYILVRPDFFWQEFSGWYRQRPSGPLVTTGTFAISRNPIYRIWINSNWDILYFPNWILLLFLVAGLWLLNRQVLREEESLKKIYGEEYLEYCKKVPRYL